MRRRIVALLILIIAAGAVISYFNRSGDPTESGAAPAVQPPAPPPPAPAAPQPESVSLNRGSDVLDGFRGEVHPLLAGGTRLNVAAHWAQVGKGRDQLHRTLHPKTYAWFTDLRPVEAQHTYTERELSALLPQTVGDVGQMWAIDLDKMAGILKQFHPRPLMHLVAAGRRAGPDGAFAILRAVSPTHLDIVFRVHTEFYLTPDDWPADVPILRAWYTPAYLSGRVVVNRQAGTVEHFRLWLPTEKSLNVHLTTDLEDVNEYKQARDVVRVERMELVGGDASSVEKIAWARSLTTAEADTRLAKVFYRFLEIDWVPFERVQEEARRRALPIYAVVSWGSFEDQSC